MRGIFIGVIVFGLRTTLYFSGCDVYLDTCQCQVTALCLCLEREINIIRVQVGPKWGPSGECATSIIGLKVLRFGSGEQVAPSPIRRKEKDAISGWGLSFESGYPRPRR